MKLYLAGPMSDLPDLNFPAFHAEAARLRALGYDVVNPAELNPDQATSWAACMRKDIPALLTCDAVAVLPDHEQSRGARLECLIAFQLEMPVFDASALRFPAWRTRVARARGASA